jgi:hypothetical protein
MPAKAKPLTPAADIAAQMQRAVDGNPDPFPVRPKRGRPRKVVPEPAAVEATQPPELAQVELPTPPQPDGYTSPVELHQRWLRNAARLMTVLEKQIDAGTYDVELIKAFREFGATLTAANKEARLQEKEASLDADALTDQELIDALGPMFLAEGWTPPATYQPK